MMSHGSPYVVDDDLELTGGDEVPFPPASELQRPGRGPPRDNRLCRCALLFVPFLSFPSSLKGRKCRNSSSFRGIPFAGKE